MLRRGVGATTALWAEGYSQAHRFIVGAMPSRLRYSRLLYRVPHTLHPTRAMHGTIVAKHHEQCEQHWHTDPHAHRLT